MAPNPLARRARASLRLDAPADARVAVLDALGRTVAVNRDGPLAAGETTLSLDAARLPPGVYAVRVASGTGTRSVLVTVAR